MAKLMGVRPLSRVELMLWVRGVTIKYCDAPNSDKCVFAESHIGQLLGRTGLY